MIKAWESIAMLDTQRRSGMENGGWAYDAYPDIETLDAGRTITIAEIEGPAVITRMHIIRHFMTIPDPILSEEEKKILAARGVIFEVYYDGNSSPAIRAPLGDFFADGCGGKSEFFTTPFIEIAPNSYNCSIPMPFKKSARIVLKNETAYDIQSYAYVEFERLPEWNEKLGYLHATWRRFAFQLYGETNEHFFHVDGKGHLLGRSWSMCTDEPFFKDFFFVMEGNNEFRVDGEKQPSIDYLGTECAFGCCGGYPCTFHGLYNGVNFVHEKTPSMVSVYRFRGADVIRFNKSLDLRVSWVNEFKHLSSKTHDRYLAQMVDLHEKKRGWIDYTTTTYWYQESVGYDHEPMMSLEDRVKPILHPNSIK